MKKIKIASAVIAVLLLAIVNVIIFTVPVKLNLTMGDAFWVSFVFLNVGVCVAILGILIGLKDKQDGYLNMVVILAASYTYIADEITAANLFVFHPHWPLKSALICQVSSFLVYLLIMAGILLASFVREHNNAEIKEKVNFVNSLSLKLEKAILTCKDASTKESLAELKEALRDSDPMSTPEAAGEEKELEKLCEEIANKCEAGEEGVNELIEKAKVHLKLRNEICLKSK